MTGITGIIRSVCLTCRRVYAEAPAAPGRGDGVSHGTCGPECDAAYRVRIGAKPRQEVRS